MRPIVRGSILDVLRCAIRHMRERTACNDRVALLANSTANGEAFWNPGLRFWTNVRRFANSLPISAKFENVLFAMERYPSSLLVYSGIKPLFDKYKRLGTKQIGCLLPRPSTFSEFSPSKKKGTARDWYETECHTRFQEIAVHLTAISEYVMRCACSFVGQSETSFLAVLDSRVKMTYDDESPHLVLLCSQGLIGELSESEAETCLRLASESAHNAVISGSKVAGRKIGKKSQRNEVRQKVGLKQLRAIPDQIKDCLVLNLRKSVNELLDAQDAEKLDIDEFCFAVTKLFRRANDFYQRIGIRFFGDVLA